jgi:ATP-dependent exoDNAse (exonuclease V) beta subunit
VLWRPLELEGSFDTSVKPGLHQPECGDHAVVWWDPAILKLSVEPRMGLHYEDILSLDQDGRAEESIRRYESWKAERSSRVEKGSSPSLDVFIATDAPHPPAGFADRVEVIHIPRSDERPSGPRFGSLAHVILRDAPLTASKDALRRLAQTHGRLLAASDEEVDAAATAVFDALQHSLLMRARSASRVQRELPVTLRTEWGSIFEGVIDLAFLESNTWIIADFKTDADKPDRQLRYRRQVGWYVHAMERITGLRAAGCLLHI